MKKTYARIWNYKVFPNNRSLNDDRDRFSIVTACTFRERALKEFHPIDRKGLEIVSKLNVRVLPQTPNFRVLPLLILGRKFSARRNLLGYSLCAIGLLIISHSWRTFSKPSRMIMTPILQKSSRLRVVSFRVRAIHIVG